MTKSYGLLEARQHRMAARGAMHGAQSAQAASSRPVAEPLKTHIVQPPVCEHCP